ncbi:MAG TPA: hypothetical protein QF549_01995 [Candidatus Saccharimonadaceae bacterium]|nr:hypothetical protein [Candidatus Saccharimonadaceae bacterium]|tara:strand:- start:2211 stop:2588 length:378 start_codon:yes stop_codon:yes gene_type:complete
MTEHEHPEEQPSPERKMGFPVIGDIIETTHFPLGVVMSTHFPESINAGAIQTLDADTARITSPGTIRISEVIGIKGHWDIDQVAAAWIRNWENMGLEMTPEKKREVHTQLLAEIAIDQARRHADQ